MRSLALGGALAVGLAGCYAALDPGELAEPPSARLLPEMTPSVPAMPEVEPHAEVDTVRTELEPESPEPPEPLDAPELRLAASPVEPRQLALWTESTLWVSDDDGSSWLRVLAGDGRMWQAVLDDDGGLWALRGTRLGHRGSDGRERWEPLPATVDASLWTATDAVEPHLAFSRGWIGIAVPHPEPEHLADVLLTHDGGAHWRSLAVGSTMSSPSIATIELRGLAIDARDRVELLVEWGQGFSCAVTYTTIHRGSLRGKELPAVVWYPEDVFEVAIDLHGWTYASCPDGELCVHAPPPKGVSLPWTPEAWRTEPDLDFDLFQTSRGRVLGVGGSRLVSFSQGRVKTLAEDIPEGATLLAEDVADRPLMRDETGIVRREHDGSWTMLRPTSG